MNQEDDIYTPELKKYSYDWNNLMRVIDKIESLDYRVTINFSNCFIEKYTGNLKVGYGEIEVASDYGDNKFDVTYNAIIEFIKYYNKLNK